MRNLVLWMIRVYQRTLSLDHGPFRWMRPHGQCKFYPTCSVYAAQAVQRYGVAKGLRLFFVRFLRCHPWAIGGVDEVPPLAKKD